MPSCSPESVEIVTCHYVTEANYPDAAHLVVEGIGENNVSAAVIGTATQKKISLRDTVVGLTKADLPVAVEKGVVADRVTPRFDGEHFRFSVIVVCSPVGAVDGPVEGIEFYRRGKVGIAGGAHTEADRFPAVTHKTLA